MCIIYIHVYHSPHNGPTSQNFPKILSSKRCTAVTNPSTYQPRSRNEGGAVPFRSATTAFRVAKYLAVSTRWLDGPLEKRMNLRVVKQADFKVHWCQNTCSIPSTTGWCPVCMQINSMGKTLLGTCCHPNVHILIARKRVYLLCSIGISCTDASCQVGDERYRVNTTTVLHAACFGLKNPSFLPPNFKHS